jgi:hypothetical protein
MRAQRFGHTKFRNQQHLAPLAAINPAVEMDVILIFIYLSEQSHREVVGQADVKMDAADVVMTKLISLHFVDQFQSIKVRRSRHRMHFFSSLFYLLCFSP